MTSIEDTAMNLEILISTNNERIYNVKNLILLPNKNIRYLISHQIFDGKQYQFKCERKDVDYKINKTKGLSRNRNIALSMASADICLITDDDVNFSKKFLSKILKAFEENQEADIITFKIRTKPSELEFIEYPHFAFYHNIRTIFKVASIEIAFRLKSIQQTNLKFDANFGLGSLFIFGEENIFLMDALKKGLKIKFVPYYIVSHPYECSGFLNKFSKRKIISLGALFYRMFGVFCVFFNIYSAFYNYQDYKSQKSFLKYLTLTFQGSWLAYKTINHKLENSFSVLLKTFFRFLYNNKR